MTHAGRKHARVWRETQLQDGLGKQSRGRDGESFGCLRRRVLAILARCERRTHWVRGTLVATGPVLRPSNLADVSQPPLPPPPPPPGPCLGGEPDSPCLPTRPGLVRTREYSCQYSCHYLEEVSQERGREKGGEGRGREGRSSCFF